MNNYILISVLGLFFCLYIWIGKQASKNVKTNSDYFLMGRNLTFFSLSMTLFATMLGGGMLMGAAQAAYTKGWAVMVYPVGTLLGFLILGMGFGAKLRQLKIATISEIFEAVYQSKTLRSVASVISIVSLYSILVGQGIAIRGFFTAIGITNQVVFFLFWATFITYTIMGGFKAVVDTDVVQAIFMLVGLAIALFSLDLKQVTTALKVASTLPSATIPWTSWFLLPLCYILIGQDMGQRCFAAKNPKLIGPASFFAGVLLLLGSGVAVAFGLLANTLKIEAAPGANILLTAVIQLTPPLVSTLFAAVVIMAIASTADSILCSISSNICSDFSFMGNMAPKQQLRLSRVVTFLLGVSALIFMFLFDNVVEVLMFSYEFSISTLFVAIVMGVLSKRPSKRAAAASMAGGILGFFIFRVIATQYSKELLTLLLSATLYLVVAGIESRLSLQRNTKAKDDVRY